MVYLNVGTLQVICAGAMGAFTFVCVVVNVSNSYVWILQ